MGKDNGSYDVETTKAELFEEISHPVRIKILEALNEKPMGFAELGRAVGIESGGHLSFHLTKLRHLIRTNSQGDYVLTTEGKEALLGVKSWEGKPEPATLNMLRIAVLPFTSISPDPNDEYLADGLTEELITRISLVKGLEVIARTSVMGFKKKEKNVSEIGRELKVGTLLEGSVRKAGNRIRVSAQLINANTEGHIWGQTYDRSIEDLFEVQSSVAENVAGVLKLKLLDEDRERLESTTNMEVYTMYLRAMQLFHEGTETSCREAILLFEGAVSKDPTFAGAYAGLASTWVAMRRWVDFATCIDKAETAARKALELGPGSAEAHTAMARVHRALDRFEESLLELETAIRINPNLAEANQGLGVLYAVLGRFGEGIECLQKARSLDPLDSGPVSYLSQVLRVAGRVDDALEMAERLMEIHPNVTEAYVEAALCYLKKTTSPEPLTHLMSV